ncbi:LytR family transcriptional attenuator [Streptomyces brevispora]|uniref:LytR family transcriptional attenuator n=1 Tax=Streptomyces brevispora TaxID=887462 RepID=A0A561UVX4_9ACTN|nr:LytR family transcriptional attenuator [Streptomyces brevispora]
MDADVTESAGTPADPDDAGAGEDQTPDGLPVEESGKQPAPGGETRSGSGSTSGGGPSPAAPDPGSTLDITVKRRRHWLRWTALGASFVVLVAAGTGWWLYKRLDGNIKTDTSAAAELKTYEKERPVSVVHDAENILLIGSDSRAGDNRKYGRDDGGSQRSDTTILLHMAADRKSTTAMSIPRDLMVNIPACHRQDKTTSKPQFSQFNWAFEFGGTACTIRTVEKMTGVRIDHYMVVDFNGFKDMVDAVKGVDICLKEPINDTAAHLKLPAGRQKLNGEQALGYVRVRKSIGNGSDTERMDRQQQFLGALVNKVQSNGVLLNPTRLYPVLDAATKALTTDPGLDTLKDLYELVRGMRNVPTDKVQFLTVPRKPYTADPNRDELVQPDADRLFKQLRDDTPLAVVPADQLNGDQGKNTGQGSEHSQNEQDDGGKSQPGEGSTEGESGATGAPGAGPTPTYSGNNAAADLCKR